MNLRNTVHKMARVAAWVAMALTFFMMLLVTADVVGTKFFNKPVPGMAEIAEELVVLLVFLGLAFTEAEIGHLRITILFDRLSQKWRQILNILGYYVLGLVIVAILSWRSFILLKNFIAIGSMKQGIISFPLWPFAVLIALSSLIFAFVLLSRVIEGLLLIRERSQAKQ